MQKLSVEIAPDDAGILEEVCRREEWFTPEARQAGIAAIFSLGLEDWIALLEQKQRLEQEPGLLNHFPPTPPPPDKK